MFYLFKVYVVVTAAVFSAALLAHLSIFVAWMFITWMHRGIAGVIRRLSFAGAKVIALHKERPRTLAIKL